MCGIAGCIGHECASSFTIEAIDKMENRGYDSAGIATLSAGGLDIVTTIGGVADLPDRLSPDMESSDTAIGHTRWASNGGKSIINAHPHTNALGTIAVVHNGIIENARKLKLELEDNGYNFKSETDTEVIPHLFDYYLTDGLEPDEAFRKTLTRLSGAYAVLALTTEAPESLYVAAASSPLILGLNANEHFAVSEESALIGVTDKVAILEDHQMAILSKERPRVSEIKSARKVSYKSDKIMEEEQVADKGDYPDFMLKEIHDTPQTVRAAIAGRIRPEKNQVKLGGLDVVREQLKSTERIIIVGCGTSYYAGLIGKRLIQDVAGIPVQVEMASEFKDDDQPFDKNTAVIAISQSGESADTSAAIQKAGEYGLLQLGVINKPSSKIWRLTKAGVLCHAGQEVSVASTKAFVSQVTVLAEIALSLAQKSNRLQQPLIQELPRLPGKIESLLANTADIQAAAEKYSKAKNFLYIGRGYNYPVALEGALKLKEISYIHAEGTAAGEMKHGPLAMIDKDFPTFAIATNSEYLEKTRSNIIAIKSRGGPVLALATEGNSTISEIVDDVIYVPESIEQTQPILNTIALQLFAYYVTRKKELNVDQPRNLAKTVTVE